MKKFLLGLFTGLFVASLPVAFGTSLVKTNFTDVKDSDWYAEYANSLKNWGVVSGYEDGTFRGSNLVTRAELAKFIVKSLEITASSLRVEELEEKFEALNAKVSTLDFPGDCYYEEEWYDLGEYKETDTGTIRCNEDGRMVKLVSY